LGLGVVWESNQTGNDEIYFSFIQEDWTALAPVNLSEDRHRSHSPSVAWDGTQYAVLWSDHRVDDRSQLMLTTVSSNGIHNPQISHLDAVNLASNRSSIVAKGVNEFRIAAEMSPTENNESFLMQIYAGEVVCTPESQDE
jgi:hypothetical protein